MAETAGVVEMNVIAEVLDMADIGGFVKITEIDGMVE